MRVNSKQSGRQTMSKQSESNSRKTLSSSKGFSAVELLITLFIAAAFMISGFQLYALVIKDGGEAGTQARAGNAATEYLQRFKSSATNPCTVQAPLTDSSVTVSGLSNVTATVAISCPPYTSAPTTECTGGTITRNGGYTIHTFLLADSGTNLVCTSNISADILVVGGGGGGGGQGAGGGGGVRYNSSFSVAAGAYGVTVGGGSLGNGQNSIFSTLIAVGGGAGASYGSPNGGTGSNGGSGGGGGSTDGAGTQGAGGAGTAGQGYSGGGGAHTGGYAGGGGGGAGGAGVNGASNKGGNGGNGTDYSSSFGTGVGQNGWFGGGGGGTILWSSSPVRGSGGNGGGGQGGQSTGATDTGATSGLANTGGGGGGSEVGSGSGGSGVVIIRYLTPVSSPITSISKISVTIEYGTPQQTITNATYVKP